MWGSPSSRCETASGPAVPLPGIQHPWGKVRIGAFHTQWEAREMEKSRECNILNYETQHQEFPHFRVCLQPWRKVSLSWVLAFPVRAKGTKHSTDIQHLSGSTHSSGLLKAAGRRHYLSPKLLGRFQWGFLHHMRLTLLRKGAGERVFSEKDERVKVESKQATQLSL